MSLVASLDLGSSFSLGLSDWMVLKRDQEDAIYFGGFRILRHLCKGFTRNVWMTAALLGSAWR